MIRIAIIAGVAVVSYLVARFVQRRSRPAPTRTGAVAPDHLDRRDFASPSTPWLVAVFTSATCGTCAGVWAKAQLLASDDVAVEQIDFPAQRRRHDRYRIDAVPLVVVADDQGVVRRWFAGPTTAEELWGAVAELRGGTPSV